MTAPDRDESGRYAFDGLDRVFHEKARLGILTCLVSHADGMAFGELRDLCGLTDGNLNRHLAVLQEAGLVEIDKGYLGKRPRTICRLTNEGQTQFEAYLRQLESVVTDALAAVRLRLGEGFGFGERPA